MTNLFNGYMNKALVAFAVGIIVLILAHFGFKADGTIQAALTTLITALLVYLVPNK